MHRNSRRGGLLAAPARSWAGLALAGLVLAACTLASPEARYYDMPLPEGEPARSAPLLDGTVEVRRPSVSGLYSERAIVFARRDRPQRQQYTNAYWIESPDRLVQQGLMRAWRARGLAERLVTPDMRQQSQWAITARLENLTQVGPVAGPDQAASGQDGGGQTATANQVRLTIELVLLRTPSNTIFLHDYFQVTVPAGQDLDAFARAAGGAVDRVAAQFMERVAARIDGEA